MWQKILYVGNDNAIVHDRTVGGCAGEYVNDATLTAQVKDSEGSNVGSAVPLDYVADSNGKYCGTLPDTLPLTAGDQYTVVIDGSSPTAGNLHREIPAVALVRLD